MDVSEKDSGRWSGTWCLLLTFPELFRLAVAYQFRAPYQDLLSKNNYKWFLGCLARAGGFSPCARALLVELLPLQTEEAGSRERAFLMGKGDPWGRETQAHSRLTGLLRAHFLQHPKPDPTSGPLRAYCVPISSSIPSRILPQGLCTSYLLYQLHSCPEPKHGCLHVPPTFLK